MNIGKALTLCRTQKEMTITALAKEAGISTTYLSLIEKNERTPNLDVINRLCKILEIPPSLLVFLASSDEDKKGLSDELVGKLSQTILSLMSKNA